MSSPTEKKLDAAGHAPYPAPMDQLSLFPSLPEGRECEGCGKRFVPKRRDKRFCSRKCRKREYHREYYRRPDVREWKREYNREYQRRPDVRERAREYEQRPDARERKRERDRRPDVREKKREYNREYRSRPDARERKRAAGRKRTARLGGKEKHRRRLSDLLIAQEGLCGLCGHGLPKDRRQVHVDHIYPVSLGGTNAVSNLQAVCKPCNESKHDSTMAEYALRVWPQV